MRTSINGINLIKQYEGLRLTAYPDPATGGDPWTVGYGHTGAEVHRGLKITPAQADAYLVADLAKFETAVTRMVTVPITQGQFDALVSFAYNLGPANLKSSTLLRMVNQGQKAAAADQFGRWNKAAGKVMAGLTKRRAAERALFLS